MNFTLEKNWRRVRIFLLNSKKHIYPRSIYVFVVHEKSKRIQEENERKYKSEMKRVQLRKRKRIRCTPPGLKIFQPSYFKYFSRKNLDLEREFGYSGRSWILAKFDMSDHALNEIFKTPWKFMVHLSPETTSPLIRNEDDFVKICDFLFFTHVSTRSELTAATSKKSLFSLLKNYAFTGWKLGLRHIVPTMLNLGMEESAIMSQANYDTILGHRQDRNKISFSIDKVLPKFFVNRFEGLKDGIDSGNPDPDSETECPDDLINAMKNMKLSYIDSGDEENAEDYAAVPEDYKWDPFKYDLIRRCIKTICDLICTFPLQCTAVPEKKSDNWLESLVTFYILATVASDWHLITDSHIFGNIMDAFRVMLDGYSKEMWRGHAKASHQEVTNSISNDVTEALVSVGDFKGAENLRPWFDDEVPINLSEFDHHHNIVRRLQLLPPTYRGQMVKKMIAHYHLQTFLGVKEKETLHDANAEDAFNVLDKHKNSFNSFADDLYVVMSILRLVDALVGNEPFIDFTEDIYSKYIAKIEQFLAKVVNLIASAHCATILPHAM